MTIPSENNYIRLKRFARDYSCGIDIPALFFYIFLAGFTSLKIDGAVVCFSLAVNMTSYGNVNVDEFSSIFFFYVQNEMLCTKHIIVFSFGNSFH